MAYGLDYFGPSRVLTGIVIREGRLFEASHHTVAHRCRLAQVLQTERTLLDRRYAEEVRRAAGRDDEVVVRDCARVRDNALRIKFDALHIRHAEPDIACPA